MSVDVEVCNGADGKSSPEGILGASGEDLKEVRFVVYGRPVPKERPRVVNGHAYTPQKTRVAEERVGFAYRSAYRGFKFGRGVPLKMEVKFTYVVPKGVSKRVRAKMEAGEVFPVGKPDVDNILKLVQDSGNGLIWHDDSQIVEVEARKVYGGEYKTEIRIVEVGGCAE